MVTHSNKQIKEHLPTMLHLRLHRATSLEGAAAANDESQVVGSELGVTVWGMSVGPASRRKDCGDLHARAKTLLAEGEAFEVVETVMLCRTAEVVRMGRSDDGIDLLNGSVLQQRLLDGVVVDCSFSIVIAFELPCILSLIVQQLGVVVSLVEILKHC